MIRFGVFAKLTLAIVIWVPGHLKVTGNKEVDKAARRALARPLLPLPPQFPIGHYHNGISSAAHKSATVKTPKQLVCHGLNHTGSSYKTL